MQALKENIIEILIKSKRLTREQIEEALSAQKEAQAPFKKILVDKGFISEAELLALISAQLYIPILHLSKYKFDPKVTRLVPAKMARQHSIIPLSCIGNTLTIAMADPLNIFALDDLKSITGCNIDTVLSPEEEIVKAVLAQYPDEPGSMKHTLEEELSERADAAGTQVELIRQNEIELTEIIKESQKPPIVKLVELMLMEALKKRASDIHIEPQQNALRIRYRVDGSLYDIFQVPKSDQNAVLARVKIISNIDITENRLPQDGRFQVRFENKEVDLRVSSLPTTFGQKFVLRLLDKSNLSIGLDKLGFSAQVIDVFNQAIAKPFGMILVTGPTGSGKSTTLYSVLNKLNTVERNIVTVEDPVEYQVEGITQMQVKPEINLSFASGLRSILRQSPDVIMIGEIRDSETADIAIKASLTGQLVLSTLHTNDAISSITRLIDMGVEPFLVASSLVMLCAQRLCRRLCMKCRKPVDIPQSFLDKIGFGAKVDFYQAAGCSYCNNTGFYGRVAVLEIVMVNDHLREMIVQKSSLDEIKKYAVEKLGMRILREEAFLKVQEGLTTLDEALRVTTET
ncbi:MAG: Flp pilus assembly complex ATPase component TadA [Candidatus Omnitrophica bacterium]|nr:Flp pilus assembly complex ATPase component TadA [Candidatus Omnitrophota bacterium]